MTQQVKIIPIKLISAGNNDRTVFKQGDLETLAASIKENGLAQPVTVRLVSKNSYRIVCGERRFRAVQILGLPTIRALVADLTDEEAAAIMLAENTGRKDLDPIDEARAYQIRIDKYNWTIPQCAKNAGVSEIQVQFRLKLLKLREDLHLLIRNNHFQIGYAQILADANLDTNRQLLAFNALRDCAKPTPGWFRNVVNEYAQQQQQAGLFDQALFQIQEVPAAKQSETLPPHPATHSPITTGDRPVDRIKSQADYWTLAADQWQKLGKVFKAQECKAAAQSALYAAAIL